jgi:hypothetical protein
MKFTIALTTLILALPLAACSEDEPAVCGSVDDLRASVDDVREVDVTGSDDLTDLQSALTAVESDFAEVKTDARSEFNAPVDAVETSLTALKTSVEQAQSAPAADTLAAAASDLSAFGSEVQTLIDDVQSTC